MVDVSDGESSSADSSEVKLHAFACVIVEQEGYIRQLEGLLHSKHGYAPPTQTPRLAVVSEAATFLRRVMGLPLSDNEATHSEREKVVKTGKKDSKVSFFNPQQSSSTSVSETHSQQSCQGQVPSSPDARAEVAASSSSSSSAVGKAKSEHQVSAQSSAVVSSVSAQSVIGETNGVSNKSASTPSILSQPGSSAASTSPWIHWGRQHPQAPSSAPLCAASSPPTPPLVNSGKQHPAPAPPPPSAPPGASSALSSARSDRTSTTRTPRRPQPHHTLLPASAVRASPTPLTGSAAHASPGLLPPPFCPPSSSPLPPPSPSQPEPLWCYLRAPAVAGGVPLYKKRLMQLHGGTLSFAAGGSGNLETLEAVNTEDLMVVSSCVCRDSQVLSLGVSFYICTATAAWVGVAMDQACLKDWMRWAKGLPGVGTDPVSPPFPVEPGTLAPSPRTEPHTTPHAEAVRSLV